MLTVLANNLRNTWDIDILGIKLFNVKKEEAKQDIHISLYTVHFKARKLHGFIITQDS